MKKILTSLFLLAAISVSVLAESVYEFEFYIVNDANGYTQMYNGPGDKYDLVERVANNKIMVTHKIKPVIDGWVAVNGIYVTGKGELNDFRNQTGIFIHQNNLKKIEEEQALHLRNYIIKNAPGGWFNIYAVGADMPGLFTFQVEDDCNLVVVDIINDKIILQSEPPVCYDIIYNNTLSFSHMYSGHNNNPLFVIYNIYRTTEGGYDYYTDLFPTPHTVSQVEAEKITTDIRHKILTELEGNGKNYYQLPDFWFYSIQLFTAYCSGIDARDIITNSDCDASTCQDIKILNYMFDAYKRSLIKPTPDAETVLF